jgi:hypothetical protein
VQNSVNKKNENIKYSFANKERSSYSEADFLRDNPGKTAADYVEFKKLSDEDSHNQKLADYRSTYLNLNLDFCDRRGMCWSKSPEDILIDKINSDEYTRRRKRQIEVAKKALETLTETQYRRYVLHIAYEMTLRKIAELDGVGHSKVQKSINAAKIKIQRVVDAEWRNKS